MGRQSTAPFDFDPKLSEAAFSTVFRSSFRPEADSDVISGMVVDPMGEKVLVKLVILGQTVLEIYDCLTLHERQRRRRTLVIT